MGVCLVCVAEKPTTMSTCMGCRTRYAIIDNSADFRGCPCYDDYDADADCLDATDLDDCDDDDEGDDDDYAH